MSSSKKRKTGARVTCPNCGATTPKSVLLCDCGYHFQTQEVVLVGDGPSASRDGHLIRITKGGRLPDYCVWCGQASAHRMHRTFYWASDGTGGSPWLMGPGVLVFNLFLAVAFSRRTVLDVPLCDGCLAARRRKIWIGAALLLCAVAISLVVAVVRPVNSGWGILIAIIAFIAGWRLVIRNSGVLRNVERDDFHSFVTFSGASYSFLARLPRT